MGKKNTLIIYIVLACIIIAGVILLWLNNQGYIKILGSTKYYQKVESVDTLNQLQNYFDYSNLDFTSGVIKLKSTISEGQASEVLAYSFPFQRCCGQDSFCQSCSLTRNMNGSTTFYLPPEATRVTFTSIQSDDYYTSLVYNGNSIINGQQKYHGDIDVTPYINRFGANTITTTVIDTAGGNIAYGLNVNVYKMGSAPDPVTSYSGNGYYISKIVGNEDVNSFDKIVLKGENKPANTDIYYQFRFSSQAGFNPLTTQYICQDSNPCTEPKYYPSSGEIDLSKVPGYDKNKYMAVKIYFSSADGKNTPTLDGFDVFYTQKEVIPNYKITSNFSYQSKSHTQSKIIKINITDQNKTSKQKRELELNSSNYGQYLLDDYVGGNLKFYVKGAKHLSRLAEKNITSDQELTYQQLLAGDFNDDDTVNSLDWSVMNAYWWKENPDFDLTGDNVINSLDWSIMNGNWGKRGEGLEDNINF